MTLKDPTLLHLPFLEAVAGYVNNSILKRASLGLTLARPSQGKLDRTGFISERASEPAVPLAGGE